MACLLKQQFLTYLHFCDYHYCHNCLSSGIKKFCSVESTPEVGMSGDKIALINEAKKHCQVVDPGNLTNIISAVTDPIQNLVKPCQVKLKKFEVLKLYCQQEFVEF